MEFIDCSEEELRKFKKEYDLKLSWFIPDNSQKVKINDEIVALIDISEGDAFKKNSIVIDSFEVFKKGQGIGSEIFEEILKIYGNQTISLYPDNERCKKFWIKHGFEIVDEGGDVERLVYNKNI